MKNILVVNVNWVGDVVFSTPVFKALKQAYPKAKISCLAVPRVREVLEGVSFIDEIITYDEKGEHWNPFSKLKLIFKLKKKKFDSVFLLHGSLTRALLVCWAGIPVRVGYPTKNRGKYLTHCVDFPTEKIHRSDYYLRVIESFGVKVSDRTTQLTVSKDAVQQIDDILNGKIHPDDFVVMVNLGGNWDLKRWPKQNFNLLIRHLTKEFNARIIIPGAQKDSKLAHEIAEGVSPRPLVLAGLTNLKQLVAMMKRTDLMITADTGPLHLADSVGCKTIALYGPTDSALTGPRGAGSSIVLRKDVGCNTEACYFLNCPDNICMQAISVEDVIDAVKKIKNK